MNAFSGQSVITSPGCGASAAAGAAFCGQCGAVISDPLPEHSWMISVPMISNRFMLYDLAKLLVWTALIIAILMFVTMAAVGDSHDFWENYLNILRMFAYVLTGFAAMIPGHHARLLRQPLPHGLHPRPQRSQLDLHDVPRRHCRRPAHRTPLEQQRCTFRTARRRLPLDDGPERVGIQLRLTTGEAVDLKWTGLLDFSGLLDALWRTGYYRPSSQGFGGR